MDEEPEVKLVITGTDLLHEVDHFRDSDVRRESLPTKTLVKLRAGEDGDGTSLQECMRTLCEQHAHGREVL